MARVVVDVMLKPEILDPQGEAVANALPRLGVGDVSSVRIGKRIEIEFAGAPDLDLARQIADKLLANPVIEDFTVRLDGADDSADGSESGPTTGAAAGAGPAGIPEPQPTGEGST